MRHRLQAALPDEVREQLDGATVHQLEALAALTRHGALTMNDLARCQHTALSSATALADRLTRQGLAERCSDPDDRRVVRLVPTARAREVMERFHNAKVEGALRLMEALDDEEAETFIRLLQRIAGDEGEAT